MLVFVLVFSLLLGSSAFLLRPLPSSLQSRSFRPTTQRPSSFYVVRLGSTATETETEVEGEEGEAAYDDDVDVYDLTDLDVTIPEDLIGSLNPKNTWEIDLNLKGQKATAIIPEGMSVLEAAEQIFEDAPFDCRNGVCTTCSAKVTGGKEGEDYLLNRDSLEGKQKEAGYQMTCQTYVKNKGCSFDLGKHDEVYQLQYGWAELIESGKKQDLMD
uniref:2Fe-2S ferredoxin-type domain-containing protein n=1 Tax=Chromera velia CCMP2878 TaxID=1169474 RepID=A0A0G4I4U4_9ALVE|mmetsp:Transcript_55985/g.109576  ORF Transcript_55985/g.109576 Transcript_55985/m.109576 type:complete len:214 (-) Transcript_55985:476-1117(-)|eukprot:Cvel_10969.t1-p1 / transcript=Cvel_10969.t1 / gene=Cvel_10969 / organism=Chromera_velia_CCMP2878 / gene_product=Ferredoxin, putative / transcript_product=Ferredoxin, putative / location=Cvel_scaffold675:13134-13772(+) / protein_length=213 / sequence_SO=supercontig / SO=protein_coding / is_pseudo=false